MRIIGGENRGLRLASVGKGDAGAHLRPTPDRLRESLFSILAGEGLPEAALVLDLFAGTGALGLEALSRGAERAVFVETGRVALRLLSENIAKTRREGQTEIIRRDTIKLGLCPGDPATLIFLDPPYGKGLGQRALAAARDGGWIAPGARIVWEEAEAMDPPDGFTLLDRRRYGTSHLTFLEAD